MCERWKDDMKLVCNLIGQYSVICGGSIIYIELLNDLSMEKMDVFKINGDDEWWIDNWNK